MKKFFIRDIISMIVAYQAFSRKIYRYIYHSYKGMENGLLLVIENKDGYIDHYTEAPVKYEEAIVRMFWDYDWDPKDIERVKWDFINGRR